MSSPFAFLQTATKKSWKAACDSADRIVKAHKVLTGEDISNQLEEIRQQEFERQASFVLNEIARMKRMREIIENDFQELITMSPKEHWYLITIRPDDTKCTFVEFKDCVHNLLARKCFLDYVMVFEQKSTSHEDLGRGFHSHILAKMRQRSKGEVLRDVSSTFAQMISREQIAQNCIDVRVASQPNGVRQYLIEGTSADGHKEATHAWDEVWRTELGLHPSYQPTLS